MHVAFVLLEDLQLLDECIEARGVTEDCYLVVGTDSMVSVIRVIFRMDISSLEVPPIARPTTDHSYQPRFGSPRLFLRRLVFFI